MKKNKVRLDVLLFNKGLAESRAKAKSLIMSGIVYVDNQIIDKAGTMITEDSNVEIKNNKLIYVSRGGLKLAKALEYFRIDVKNKIAADIGASTGGFTDCLLQNGVSKIYSIDVGYGQFAWKLRNDSRVILFEKTNIRYVTPDMFRDKIDFAAIDVSFISLTKVLPSVIELLADNGEIVCLIKPQFEAGKDKVGKKGVIKDPEVHKEVIMLLAKFIREKLNLAIKNLTYSPIKGPEGNIEYLIHIVKDSSFEKIIDLDKLIDNIVKEAHLYN
ncbi:MAG: TlyA family RNA methyltransferase [Firmicutes bacterium]|nr:TlyA family RNA methyltransferase [Bacillota bacterium]